MPEASTPSSPGTRRPGCWGTRRVEVHDDSMQPALQPGDRLRVDVHAYRTQPPRVGDLVVLLDPETPRRWIVKRVTAIGPGIWWRTARGLIATRAEAPATERPADAVETVRLGPTDAWVLGDDPERSRDSRRFGPVPLSTIVGRVFRIYAPPTRRRDL